jgi:hypothetical protein
MYRYRINSYKHFNYTPQKDKNNTYSHIGCKHYTIQNSQTRLGL